MPVTRLRSFISRYTWLQLALLFLAITGLVSLFDGVFKIHLDDANFWDRRGVFFLLAVTFFPRLTLLFSSVAFGGVLWWFGFIFFPRLLVATLATLAYWQQNPLLVLCAWFVALSGESTEKWWVFQPLKVQFRTILSRPPRAARPVKPSGGARDIEAEYRIED